MNKYTKEIKYAASGSRGSGGAFCIDNMRAEEFVSSKRNLASNMNDARGSVRTSFATLYNINQFTAGLEGMQKGMSEIASEFEYLSNIDQSFVNEGMYADDSLANKVDELYISHDFVGNNSMEINSYNKSILGKVDGTSVNEGEKSLTNAHVDESTRLDKENLVDIAKGPTVEQHAKEIAGITKEQNLDQITKDTDMTARKIDDSTTLTSENLINVNKEGGEQEQHIETHYDGVQDKPLVNIANGELGPRVELEVNADDISKATNWELKQ